MPDSTNIIYKTITSDVLTPVSAMLELSKDNEYFSLFESVIGGERKARYSIIALRPNKIWKYEADKAFLSNDGGVSFSKISDRDDIIESLREFSKSAKIDKEKFGNLPSSAAGIFGFLGYDFVKLVEDLPDENPKNIDIPDGLYFRPTITIVFDNLLDKANICRPIYQDSDISSDQAGKEIEEIIERLKNISLDNIKTSDDESDNEIDFLSNIDEKEYCDIVDKCKKYIVDGDIFQVVPSRRFEANFPYSTQSFYRSLRSLNPSPYMFFLKIKDFSIIGSSPEIMVKLEDEKVTIRPIAGTRKRGKDLAEDDSLIEDLLSDKKEVAEHLMLLDLGRNDVGRVADANSVEVTEKMIIEKYSHVMHIVSNVEGKIKPSKDAVDALMAGFPAGTVSGAPKIRAMEIIDEVEKVKRQFYAGTVGYISSDGNMDTAIALRTALLKDNKIYLQSGGGVVYDSVGISEFEETQNKANALIKATKLAKIYN